MKYFRGWTMGLVFSLSLLGCAPVVKTDLKSFKENPEAYQGKEVIITTDVKSVVEDPESYLGRKIELKGFVKYNGFRGFSHWNFFLKDEEGRSLRCYEREYRIEAWIWPTTILRRAERENEQLTVVGKLQKGKEIELDWVEYKGQTIDTDYKPPQFPVPLLFWLL
ncbi:MAG: hypothetical protein V2A69_14490 [Pseudomonadota bacterium]